MTNEQVLEMISMRMNGATLQEIGDKFGVSREWVRQYMPPALGRSFRVDDGYKNIIYPELKKWLVEHGMSQKQFAKKICMRPQNLGMFLRGEYCTSKKNIDKILAITGLTYEEAFRQE